LMSYSYYENMVFFNGVHQFLWELVKQAFSYVTTLNRPRFRIFGNPESRFFLTSSLNLLPRPGYSSSY